MNDASVQARILAHTVGIFNLHREQELAQRIEWIANQSGASLEDTRIRMVEAWSTYQRAIASGRLKWFYPTPIKFFESNLWHDSNLWPVERPTSPSTFYWPEYVPPTPEQVAADKLKRDVRPQNEREAADQLWTWRGAVGTKMEGDIPKWVREVLEEENRPSSA